MTLKKIKTIIISSIFFASLWLQFAFAENVDVTASVKSWSFNKVIKVDLNSTDSTSKTFYSFNPNWTPNDAFAYTGTIIIKKSTPLVYFTFLSTTNESKIKQEDYVINYTSDIKLWTNVKYENWTLSWVLLTNNSSESQDISYWYLKNENQSINILDGTILSPWQSMNINWLNWKSPITLFAPSDEQKDSVQVQEIIPKIEIQEEVKPEAPVDTQSDTAKPVIPKKVSYIKKNVAKVTTKKNTVAMIKEKPVIKTTVPEKPVEPAITTETVKTNTTEVSPENWSNTTSTNLSNTNPEISKPTNPEKPKDPVTSFDNSIKASVKDNQTENNTWVYVFFWLIGTAAAVGVWRRFVANK